MIPGKPGPLFLSSLKQIDLSPVDRLTKQHIHRALVSTVSDGVDVSTLSDSALRTAYLEALAKLGVSLIWMNGAPAQAGLGEAGKSAMCFRRTRWMAPPAYRSPSDESAMELLLKRTCNELARMGFGKSFARVYVTDNIPALCAELGLPASGGSTSSRPPIGAFFPIDSQPPGHPLPILMLEYHDVQLQLYPCLLHEALHLMTYFGWGVREYTGRDGLLGETILTLASEAFVNMLATKISGPQYLYTSIWLARFSHMASEKLGELTSGPETTDRECTSFLRLIPWISAMPLAPAATVDGLRTIFSPIRDSWPDDIQQAAVAVEPMLQRLYETCDLSEVHAGLLKVLGSEGPCGDRFLRLAFSDMVRRLA